MPDNMSSTRSGDLFLSYHRGDSEAVIAVQNLLQARGISTFLDREKLVAGIPWPQALEKGLSEARAVAVFIGPGGLGLWQKREMGYALDRQVQEEKAAHPFPVIPVLLPGADITTGFLFLNTWIDLRVDLADPEKIDNLAKAVEGVSDPAYQRELEPLCPYRGLHPFREEDAAFFHGREAFSRRLLDAVLGRNLVAVVGTSGSGKSSVVQAGVIRMLRRQRPPGSTWDTISFVPGARPYHNLAASLIPLLKPELGEIDRLAEAQRLGDLLAKKDVTIESAIDRIIRKSGGTDRLLIVADQFEELFTQTSELGRQAFLKSLLQALDHCAALTMVITVRGSFYDNLISASRDLSDRMEHAVINLGTMTRDELQRAVVEPAKRVGLGFEPGLVKSILDDVGNEPGNLPLLEFALTELWSRRQGKFMTHGAYEEIGTVHGAVARRADTVFTALPLLQQEKAHRLLTRLVGLEEQVEMTRATRKRVPVSELGEGAREVLKVLADARLLVIGRLGSGGEKTAEVAHEALIRHWKRLREWLDEDREFLLWRRRLQTSLAEWERTQRDEGTLLRGTPLREAERWLNERVNDLNVHEQEFISGSSSRDQKERTSCERRRKIVLFSSLGSAVVFLFLASFALIQSLEAFSRELAAGARSQLSIDPELSLLLALEAVKIKRTDEALSILRQSLMESHGRMTIQEDHIVNDVSFSTNGSRVVTGSDDNIARVWDVASGKPQHLLKLKGHTAPITAVAFNTDGSLVVTSSADKTVRVWDAITGKCRTELRGHEGPVNSASFNAEGTFIASASNDETARVWDVKSGRSLRILPHPNPVTSAAFNPGGDLLVTSSIDGTARVWSLKSDNEDVQLLDHQAPLTDAVFGPGGDIIVTAAADNMARVWKVRKGVWSIECELTGHDDSLNSVAFSPDGSLLVTSSDDRTSRVWDVRTWLPLSVLRGHTDVLTHAVFSGDSSPRVITSSRDHTVRVWASRSQHSRHALHGHRGTVDSAEFSPDDSKVITAGSDNTARIWDVSTGEELYKLKKHNDSLNGASFSPDGNLAVTSSNDNTARIWRIGANDPLHELEGPVFKGHTDNVRMAAFSPNGKLVVTASNDNTARVWDAVTGKSISILGGSSFQGQELPYAFGQNNTTFSFDETLVALTNGDEPVQIWNAKTGIRLAELKGHSKAVTSAVFSPDRNRLVTTSLDSTARIWDLTSGECLHELQGHDKAVIAAAFSPDGRLVVTGSADGTARIWESSSGKLHENSFIRKQAVTGAAFFPDGKTVLVILADTTVYAWDMGSGNVLQRMSGYHPDSQKGHRKRIYSARFSPDNMLVVTASADHTARVWSAQTGQLISVLEGHTGGIVDTHFSSDGTIIVTASKDGKAGVWKANSGQLRYMLQGHAEELTGASFSADGKWILTSSKDFTARVWDTETGLSLGELSGHRDWVNNAEFSSDGRLAVTASRDGTAFVWERSAKGKWSINSRLLGHRLNVKAQFSSDSRSVVTASRDGMARVWRLSDIGPPSKDMASAIYPSLEEICTLATKRVAHANPELTPLVHSKYLRSHELHYKVLSLLGGLLGQKKCQ